MADFATSRLGIDATIELSVADWLILTGQAVLEMISGPIFVDRTAALAQVRARLNWYPPDIERYVLAAGWQRLSQEMPMVGRTAELGDELGSKMLSTRLADDLISLAFTLSRQWPPYPKWRGTASGHSRSPRIWRPADRGGDCTTLARPGERPRRRLRDPPGRPTRPRAPSAHDGGVPFWDRPYRTVDEAVRDRCSRKSPTRT